MCGNPHLLSLRVHMIICLTVIAKPEKTTNVCTAGTGLCLLLFLRPPQGLAATSMIYCRP